MSACFLPSSSSFLILSTSSTVVAALILPLDSSSVIPAAASSLIAASLAFFKASSLASSDCFLSFPSSSLILSISFLNSSFSLVSLSISLFWSWTFLSRSVPFWVSALIKASSSLILFSISALFTGSLILSRSFLYFCRLSFKPSPVFCVASFCFLYSATLPSSSLSFWLFSAISPLFASARFLIPDWPWSDGWFLAISLCSLFVNWFGFTAWTLPFSPCL